MILWIFGLRCCQRWEYVTPTDRVRFYQIDDALAVRCIYLTHMRKKPTRVQQMLAEYIEERRVAPKE